MSLEGIKQLVKRGEWKELFWIQALYIIVLYIDIKVNLIKKEQETLIR